MQHKIPMSVPSMAYLWGLYHILVSVPSSPFLTITPTENKPINIHQPPWAAKPTNPSPLRLRSRRSRRRSFSGLLPGARSWAARARWRCSCNFLMAWMEATARTCQNTLKSLEFGSLVQKSQKTNKETLMMMFCLEDLPNLFKFWIPTGERRPRL